MVKTIDKINKNMMEMMKHDEQSVKSQIKDLKKKAVLIKKTNQLIAKDKTYALNPVYSNGIELLKSSEKTVDNTIHQLESSLVQMQNMRIAITKMLKESKKTKKATASVSYPFNGNGGYFGGPNTD